MTEAISRGWTGIGPPTRTQVRQDVVSGVLATALGAAVAVGSGRPGIVPILLVGLAMTLRRVQPTAMVVLALIAGIWQAWTLQIFTVMDLFYGLLTYTMGSDHRRRWRQVGLMLSLVAAVIAGLTASMQPPVKVRGVLLGPTLAETMATVAAAAAVTIGGWLLGRSRWRAQVALQARVQGQLEAAERQHLSHRVEQERERAQIATDMHDVVAHSLAVIAAQAAGAQYALASNPQGAGEALEVIGETARTAIADVRVLLAQLRTGENPHWELDTAQEARLLARMRASGMAVEVSDDGAPPESPWLRLTAHRLLGEALTNALQHGSLATPVRVHQDWRSGYRLRVTNAVPPDSDRSVVSVAQGKGHGIVGMRERAAAASGTVSAGRHGDTWILEADIPGEEAES